MALMRIRFISWLVLLCLIVLIGTQVLPAPASHITSGEVSWIGKHAASDPALVGIVRVGTGEKARKTIPLVQTWFQGLCSRASLSPPLIGRAVSAVPHHHALCVHQRISVYRI